MFGIGRRRRNQELAAAAAASSGVVGTEAKALENMEHNRKHFKYPESGFCNPIEHSLVYSIISAGPQVYPEAVALEHIQEENFLEYLEVQNSGPDSYAQLSAILAISADKFPPSPEGKTASISKALCKCILRCVVKYAEEHNLDRQTEVEETLKPVETYVVTKTGNEEMKQQLPFYLGYTAFLLTANPIPMLVGLSMLLNAGDKTNKARNNMGEMSSESNRIADVETAGLLDEDDLE